MRSFSSKARALRRSFAGGALAALCLMPLSAQASSREAVILGRAFAYDYNLKSRAGDELVLAVLFNPQNASAADPWLESFKGLDGVKIQGLTFRVVRLAYTGAAALRTEVASQGIDILLVCDGLDGAVGSIEGLSRSAHLLTVAAKEAFVEQGLSLGVFETGGKTEIVVNLPATSQEGVAFSSDLLRLARIIR
jgi:hypothetical protein